MSCLEAKGIISRNLVKAQIQKNDGLGIRFVTNTGLIIEAIIGNLHSTQRNTVIAKNEEYVCLTEHFLAACALTGTSNIDVSLNESELPFGDGSAEFWLKFLEKNNLTKKVESKISLEERSIFKDDNDDSRFIEIFPSQYFKVSYKMDWNHPKIGKQEYTWDSQKDSVYEIASARTFSNETENQALGLSGWVIGLTEDDFTHKLHYENEPARHKALDLVGDMMLSGVNPLNVAMHVISHKGGHELNSKVAKFLAKKFAC